MNEKLTRSNEPAAAITGWFLRLAFTVPANDKRKQKRQHVNPALRLPAARWLQ